MRKIIAALQVSVDGFIGGPNGELDWAIAEDEETWRDVFEMLTHVDTLILGRVMYPDYEQYWLTILANPAGILPISGKVATKNEIAYARLADKIPHLVLYSVHKGAPIGPTRRYTWRRASGSPARLSSDSFSCFSRNNWGCKFTIS